MDIPYYIFLIVYAIILLAYGLFIFFSIYHMVRFGFFDFVAKIHTVMLLGVVGVIIIFTGILLRHIPWTESFPILNQIGFEDISL